MAGSPVSSVEQDHDQEDGSGIREEGCDLSNLPRRLRRGFGVSCPRLSSSSLLLGRRLEQAQLLRPICFVLLVFDIARYQFICHMLTRRPHVVSPRPHASTPLHLPQRGKLVKQPPGRQALDDVHHLRRGRLTTHEQVHVVFHHFQRPDLPLVLVTDFAHHFFQPLANRPAQHRLPKLRDPDKVIGKLVDRMRTPFRLHALSRATAYLAPIASPDVRFIRFPPRRKRRGIQRAFS